MCQIEYDVEESCKGTGVTSQGCIDTRRKSIRTPTSGYVVYGVAHQHTGGTGATLYGGVIFFLHNSLIRNFRGVLLYKDFFKLDH